MKPFNCAQNNSGLFKIVIFKMCLKIIYLIYMCDTMWVVRQADDLYVCFGAKPKQRAWTRNIPRNRKWRRKGRSEGREGPVDKGTQRGQSTSESRRRTVSRRRQSGKTVKNELAFLVVFVEFSSKIHAHDSLQMHAKLHKTPFLALGTDPSPYYSFVLFLSL